MLIKHAKVAVIGTGISGLSFAYFLNKIRPDLHITLYDAHEKVGGYINTERHRVHQDQETLLEKGPRTLRGASDGTVMIVDTLLRLRAQDAIKVIPNDSIANKKYLLSSKGLLVQVPNSIRSFFKFMKSPLGEGLVSGVIREPFQSQKMTGQDESVFEFLSRRFNSQLPNNIISAVFHGVYAADVKQLSAHTALKSMVEAESQYGSVLKSILLKPKLKSTLSPLLTQYQSIYGKNDDDYDLLHLNKLLKKYPMITLDNGLSTFPKILYNHLKQHFPQIEFKFNTPINSISSTTNDSKLSINSNENYDHIRSTINVNELSKLIPNSQTSKYASKLTYVDILLINIYIPKSLLTIHGFGYLVPQSSINPMGILGVIFDSDVEKGSIQLFKDDNLLLLKDEKFPALGNEYKEQDYTKLTIMAGGHYWSESGPPESLDLLVNKIIKHVYDHLQIKEQDNSYIDYKFIKQCLPQFNVGYEELQRQFNQNLKKEFPKLSQGGMSFGGGAGVPDCVSNGFKAAMELGKDGH